MNENVLSQTKSERSTDSSNDVVFSHETDLLEWAARRKDLFKNIEERSFDLPYGRIYSFNAQGKSQKLNRKFLGIGRDLSRTTAASKAIGEAVERIVAAEIFSESK